MISTYLLASVGAALVAVTLTRSSITASLRYRLLQAPFIGGLFNCPYCMCHWTGAVFALAFGGSWLEYLEQTCIIIGLAVGYAGLLNHIWHFDDRTIAELSELLKAAQKELNK